MNRQMTQRPAKQRLAGTETASCQLALRTTVSRLSVAASDGSHRSKIQGIQIRLFDETHNEALVAEFGT